MNNPSRSAADPALLQLFLRFAAAGAVGTALHYMVLFALVQSALVGPAKAAMCGAACGAICNYFLNRRFSFRTERSHSDTAPSFFAMVVFGILANGAIVKFALLLGINYLVAQLCATLIILVLNFFICKLWIFNKHR